MTHADNLAAARAAFLDAIIAAAAGPTSDVLLFKLVWRWRAQCRVNQAKAEFYRVRNANA